MESVVKETGPTPEELALMKQVEPYFCQVEPLTRSVLPLFRRVHDLLVDHRLRGGPLYRYVYRVLDGQEKFEDD